MAQQDYVAELRSWLANRQNAPVSSAPQGMQIQRPQSGGGGDVGGQISNAIGAALKQRTLSKRQAQAAQQASAQYDQQQQVTQQAQPTGIPAPSVPQLSPTPPPQAGPLAPPQGQLQAPALQQGPMGAPQQSATPLTDMVRQFVQLQAMPQQPRGPVGPGPQPTGAPSPNFALQQPSFGR